MVIKLYKFIGKNGKMYELKFNSNCKQEEKTGEGPGSCSGNQNDNERELAKSSYLKKIGITEEGLKPEKTLRADNKSSKDFTDIDHAKGVMAARALGGIAAGPSQKQVNVATKTLQLASIIPSTYKISGNKEEIKHTYLNKEPVIGDIFEMKDGTNAEVIKIYKTSLGKPVIDINIVGKKRGRISSVYL